MWGTSAGWSRTALWMETEMKAHSLSWAITCMRKNSPPTYSMKTLPTANVSRKCSQCFLEKYDSTITITVNSRSKYWPLLYFTWWCKPQSKCIRSRCRVFINSLKQNQSTSHEQIKHSKSVYKQRANLQDASHFWVREVHVCMYIMSWIILNGTSFKAD